MLHEFLSANRTELIRRCTAKAGARFAPSLAPNVVDHGPALFLEQLAETLLREQQADAERQPRAANEKTPNGDDDATAIGRSAALHGAELLRLGYSLEQVVHGYGDVCQAITGLAIDKNVDISTDEFRTLNRCLDNAIADAVAAFGHGDKLTRDADMDSRAGRLASFAAEEQRLIGIALHSFRVIKSGSVGVNGATGELLRHALEELSAILERTLPDFGVRGESAAAAAAAPDKGV
jgi:hypothetical protein